MDYLEVVHLKELMARTSGVPEVVIGLIDGPVMSSHADFAGAMLRTIDPIQSTVKLCGLACAHGTLVAGVLSAQRGSAAPAICPQCTLLVCPIFDETATSSPALISSNPQKVAAAIHRCIEAGARVLNLSLSFMQPSMQRIDDLEQALDYAQQRGCMVVAAAGNQGTLGSSAITRHPAVIPIAACNLQGRPLSMSNLSHSISRRGLMAPGQQVVSINASGGTTQAEGTSIATPFVTGAIALLWSVFPNATATQIRSALLQAGPVRSTTVVPPLLNASAAYLALSQQKIKR